MVKEKQETRKTTTVKTIEDIAEVEIGDPIIVHAMEVFFDSGYGHRISSGMLLQKNLKEKNFSYFRRDEYHTNMVLCAPIKDLPGGGENIKIDYEIYCSHKGAKKLTRELNRYISKGGLENYSMDEPSDKELEEIEAMLL